MSQRSQQPPVSLSRAASSGKALVPALLGQTRGSRARFNLPGLALAAASNSHLPFR